LLLWSPTKQDAFTLVLGNCTSNEFFEPGVAQDTILCGGTAFLDGSHNKTITCLLAGGTSLEQGNVYLMFISV